MRRARVFALGLAISFGGCAPAAPTVNLALRVPAGDAPLAGADGVLLSVRDAQGNVLAVRRASVDAAALSVDSIPTGSGYVAELDATLGPDVVARGRSCSFSVISGMPAPTVPIYFSRVAEFAATANPLVPRLGAAVFSTDGGAIVAGGAGPDGSVLATSERYDPATGRFSPGPPLVAARAGAESAALPDGKVLVLGGADPRSPGVELFGSEKFTAGAAAIPPELVDEASLPLAGGAVLVAGGRTAAVSVSGAALLLVGDGALADDAGTLIHARRRHTLTLAGGGEAFAVGGVDGAGPVADLELFDPAVSGFELAGAQLLTPRSDHTTTLLTDGRLLIAGGLDQSGNALASAEIFDPILRQVTATAPLKTARARHAATLLPSGRVLISGGVDAGGSPTAVAEIFDPALGAAGDFVPTAPLTTARSGHALVSLCDGTLLVVGGGAGAEIYNPAP